MYQYKSEVIAGPNQKELPAIPKRVLNAFTESAINKILSKDEILYWDTWQVGAEDDN